MHSTVQILRTKIFLNISVNICNTCYIPARPNLGYTSACSNMHVYQAYDLCETTGPSFSSPAPCMCLASVW